MSQFAGDHNNAAGYGEDNIFFGLMMTGVILVTMLITTPISSWLLTGKAVSSGLIVAAAIIGLLISLPTVLTAIFNLNRGQSAALPSAVALVLSYVVTMLVASALIGEFVMTGRDIIYMGIPAVAVFVLVTYRQNRTAVAE
jgi:hypothetical protein